jgi:hypothetical protein
MRYCIAITIGMDERTLLLCYPDDFEHSDESVALESLKNYSGSTIIHVGELFGDAVKVSGSSVWGRTTSPEFQMVSQMLL